MHKAYTTHGEPTYERDKYLVRDFKNPLQIQQMLDEYGVCIFPNLFSPEETRKTFQEITAELEKHIPGFKYGDIDTWHLVRQAKATHGMILQNFGLGWLPSVVNARTKKRCISIFLRLYTYLDFTSKGIMDKRYSKWDMFSSADAFSMYLNPDYVPNTKKIQDLFSTPYRPNTAGYHRPGFDWLHWDQSPNCPIHSYQGFVNLLDVTTMPGRHNATFTFLESSHLHQRQFWTQFIRSENPRFFRLEKQDHFDFFNLSKSCAYKALDLQAGDFVLWNSRLVHQGRTAVKPHASQLQMGRGFERSVVYVSMQPKKYATDLDKKKKRKAFEELRTTTHEASYGVSLFTKFPRIFSAQEKKMLDEGKMGVPVTTHPDLNPLQKSLFCIND
jgi:hypothetical protein